MTTLKTKLNYRQQQAAIDTAIANLRDVANSLCFDPKSESSPHKDIENVLRTLCFLSDAECERRY